MAGDPGRDDTADRAPDPWFRPVWEDEPDETVSLAPGQAAAGAGTPRPLFPSSVASAPVPWASPRPAELPSLLGPLCAAQDALGRLDARAAVAPAAVREGLCARLAWREASGWLAHAHAWAHPLDLALHDLGLTLSFEIAAQAGRSAAVLRHTAAAGADAVWDEQDQAVKARGDTLVAQALTLARWLRRLALSRDHDPFACAADASALLGGFEVPFLDAERFRQWRAEFPVPGAAPGRTANGAAPAGPAAELLAPPPLLQAPQAAARWMEAGIVDTPEPLHALLAAVCLLQRTGPWRAVLVPVWGHYPTLGTGDRMALPELRHDVAARLRPGGTDVAGPTTAWTWAFLHLVAEGARAGLRELDRLEALAGQGKRVLGRRDRRSRLPDALDAVLQAPALTPKALAGRLAVAPQTATSLLRDLRAAGLVREITGRRSFRAFAASEAPPLSRAAGGIGPSRA